jgi:hypothetical protein
VTNFNLGARQSRLVKRFWNFQTISKLVLFVETPHKFITAKYIIVLFVETPRKFITAVINLRGVSTNKTIIYLIAMQTYKELNK